MTEIELMDRAIALAVENVHRGGGPFGAVVAKDGEIVSEGVNRVTDNHDPTAHAEVQAIRSACAKLGTFDLTGCTIYASCEPCPMCLGAIYWAHLDKVFYSGTREDAAAAGFDDQMIYDELEKPISGREVPFLHLEAPAASAPFDAWKRNEERTEY